MYKIIMVCVLLLDTAELNCVAHRIRGESSPSVVASCDD